jgi:hypothetical protein
MRLICSVLIMFVALSCSKEIRHDAKESKLNDTAPTDTTARIKMLTIDSVFRRKKGILIFCKRRNSNKLEQVHNERWPDSIDIVYNVCMNEFNVALLLKEIPQVESGDFSIIYSYYFSADGKTFATKSQATFFNEDCSDGAISEIRTSFYDHNNQEYMTEYFLKDRHEVSLDSSRCGFGDLPDFRLYKNFVETPVYSKLK